MTPEKRISQEKFDYEKNFLHWERKLEAIDKDRVKVDKKAAKNILESMLHESWKLKSGFKNKWKPLYRNSYENSSMGWWNENR